MSETLRADDSRGFRRARRGTRAREAAVVVLACGAIVWIILGTVRAELDKARSRFAGDTLAYLASHLTLAMHRAANAGEDPHAWEFPFSGPGAGAGGHPMAALLPVGSWLPADPWGRPYRLVLGGSAPHQYPVLLCDGPDGQANAESPDPSWSALILWPEP